MISPPWIHYDILFQRFPAKPNKNNQRREIDWQDEVEYNGDREENWKPHVTNKLESPNRAKHFREQPQLGRHHPNGSQAGSDFRLRLKARLRVIDVGSWVLGIRTPPRALSHTVGDLRFAICSSARLLVSTCNSVCINSARCPYFFLWFG